MNGLVLRGLKDYVVDGYGDEVWGAVHEKAGLEKRLYMPVAEYPDHLVSTLVNASAALTGVDEPTLLTDLGRSLAPDVLEIYGIHVHRDWSALDLVANLERFFDEAFSSNRFTSYVPPEIASEYVGRRQVSLTCDSPGWHCALLEGLVKGIGDHYGEGLFVDHRQCAEDGADRCEFVVTAAVDRPPAARPAATGPETSQDRSETPPRRGRTPASRSRSGSPATVER